MLAPPWVALVQAEHFLGEAAVAPGAAPILEDKPTHLNHLILETLEDPALRRPRLDLEEELDHTAWTFKAACATKYENLRALQIRKILEDLREERYTNLKNWRFAPQIQKEESASSREFLKFREQQRQMLLAEQQTATFKYAQRVKKWATNKQKVIFFLETKKANSKHPPAPSREPPPKPPTAKAKPRVYTYSSEEERQRLRDWLKQAKAMAAEDAERVGEDEARWLLSQGGLEGP